MLYVFAGPNGAGKSTLFEQFQQVTSPRIEQVNGDVLRQKHPEMSGFDIEARTVEQIKDLRDKRASFSIESNLAQHADYKLIHGAKAVG